MSNTVSNHNTLPQEVIFLEKEPLYFSREIFSYLKNKKVTNYNPYCFLYHGIRFDDSLSKLENIFKCKKILAGKYIPTQLKYEDNVNKGEYVSLLPYDEDGIEYNLFIETNVSLLVSPLIEAYLSKYVSYNVWDKIKDKKTKNLYSYMRNEYLCKDQIDFKFIEAIGVPYKYYLSSNGKVYADNKIKAVQELMKKYQINLPIVDTSNENKILIARKIK